MKNLFQDKRKRTMGLAIILSVIMIVIIASNFNSSPATATSTTSDTTHILPGQQGFIRTDVGSTTAVGISKDAYDAYFKAVSANDETGYYQLLNTHQIFNVPNGTKVLVTDYSWSYNKIRFMDGEHVGETGWIENDFIKTN